MSKDIFVPRSFEQHGPRPRYSGPGFSSSPLGDTKGISLRKWIQGEIDDGRIDPGSGGGTDTWLQDYLDAGNVTIDGNQNNLIFGDVPTANRVNLFYVRANGLVEISSPVAINLWSNVVGKHNSTGTVEYRLPNGSPPGQDYVFAAGPTGDLTACRWVDGTTFPLTAIASVDTSRSDDAVRIAIMLKVLQDYLDSASSATELKDYFNNTFDPVLKQELLNRI